MSNVGALTLSRDELLVSSLAVKSDDYLFGKKRTFQTFSLLCLLMVFDFADRMMLAALIPAIKAEWHITDATAGLISSVLTLGMVLFAFPASLIIDRWSRVKTAALMGILWSFASASGALTHSIIQLLVTRSLVGVGEAGYAPAAYAWIAAAFPKRRWQLALGTFTAAQPVGMALGVALGGYIATHYGWRYALGIVAIPGLLIALLLYRGQDYKNIPLQKTSAEENQVSVPLRAISILRTPSLIFAYLSSAMSTLQWVPIFFFLPTYFNRIYNIPVQTASLMVSGLMLLSVIGIPLGGWIMDHWGHKSNRAKLIYPIFTGIISTSIYGIAFGLNLDIQLLYGLIVVAFFVGSTAGTGPLVITQELVHPAFRAFSGTCGIIVLHLLGSVPGPFLAGLISDHFGLSTALFSLSVFSGTIGIISLLLALRYYKRDLAKVVHYSLEVA